MSYDVCDGQDMCPVMAPIVWQHAKVCYPNLVADHHTHRASYSTQVATRKLKPSIHDPQT